MQSIYLGVVQCKDNNNGCHGNHISHILGKMSVLNRGDVGLYTHTKVDFLYCRNVRGRHAFSHFPHKINHISRIIGKIAVLKRKGVVDLHIHTKYV